MNALRWLWNRIQAEPVATGGLIQAGVSLGCAFGLDWSGKQVAEVNGFAILVLAYITRKVVTSNINVPTAS